MKEKEFSCCSPNNCSEENVKEGEIENQTVDIIDSDIKYNDKSKLYVDIYVPLESCACEWSQFMNLVFTALTPYIKHIKHETKSLNSKEAQKLNLHGNCVIVDGKKKYTTSHALKMDLPNLLKQKGLI
jgi:hypothetical protein